MSFTHHQRSPTTFYFTTPTCESNFHCILSLAVPRASYNPFSLYGNTVQHDEGCMSKSWRSLLPSSSLAHNIPPFFTNVGYNSSKFTQETAFVSTITTNRKAAASNTGRRRHTHRRAARCLQNSIRRFAHRHFFHDCDVNDEPPQLSCTTPYCINLHLRGMTEPVPAL